MVDAPRILEGITMLHDEPLSHYTFTKTGGPADLLAFPKDVAEVQALVEMARERDMPLTAVSKLGLGLKRRSPLRFRPISSLSPPPLRQLLLSILIFEQGAALHCYGNRVN